MKFPKDTIAEMKDLIKSTDRSGNEYGGTLCSDNKNKISLENTCKGTSCSVNIRNYCTNNGKDVGSYHTHPTEFFDNEIYPSAEDLRRIELVCIGQKIKDKDKIKCFNIKDRTYVPGRTDSLDKIKDKEKEFLLKKFGIGFGKWKQMMDSHIDKYYKKFDPEELAE
jgi:hypothetical protein